MYFSLEKEEEEEMEDDDDATQDIKIESIYPFNTF